MKVQSMASVKARAAGRLTSSDTSVQSDDFTKLLQMKKDLTDIQGQTDNAKPGEGAVKKPAGEKTEESKVPEKEVSDSEDDGQQEALQKAALQQAAVQLTGILSQEPEAETVETDPVAEMVAEVAGAAVEENGIYGEAQTESDIVQTEPDTAMTEPVEEDVMAVAQEKVQQPVDEKPMAEPVQTEPAHTFRIQKSEDQNAEVKADARREDSRQDLDSSSGQKTSETVGQQMYGAGNAQSVKQTEPLFPESGRTGEIPMKTTPDTLPQDLGKTLAARLPEAGRDLTVELEPASLGKLTIRLTYEAGRAAVSILATNPRTLEILSEKAAEIASILEEKTGQETVILTQQLHEQEQYQENKHGSAGSGEQEQEHQERGKKEQHTDSFAQQLRLGLV